MTISRSMSAKDLAGVPVPGRHRPGQDLEDLDCLDAGFAALIGSLGLALYVRTLAPGLLPGDSGEFQTLACLLGDTHPTGYPVYLMLAKLLTLLPIGQIAWRVNLFSAIMAAATVAGVYVAGRRLTQSRAAAIVGALALVVSPTFWSQAIIAEVYTLGAAFLVWILVALLSWDSRRRPLPLFLAGLLGGLSLGVHMTVALSVPAVFVFVVATLLARQSHPGRGMENHVQVAREAGRPRSITPFVGQVAAILRSCESALGGALAGVVLTVLLFTAIDWHNPTASYFNSVIGPSRSAWGLDAKHLDGPLDRLLFGWSAKQFRGWMFAHPAFTMPKLAGEYWHNLPSELAWPVVVLSGIGATALLMCRPRAATLLLVALATQLLFAFNYEVRRVYVFFIPSYVLLAVLATAGMGAVVHGLSWPLSALRRRDRRRLAEPVLQSTPSWTVRLRTVPAGAAAVLILVCGVWPTFRPRLDAVRKGIVAFTEDDLQAYPVGDDSFEAAHRTLAVSLSEAPQDAIVFMDWDALYPSYYVAHIELGRADLTFIETHPAGGRETLADSFVQYIAENQADHPILALHPSPELLAAGYGLAPLRAGSASMYRVVKRER